METGKAWVETALLAAVTVMFVAANASAGSGPMTYVFDVVAKANPPLTQMNCTATRSGWCLAVVATSNPLTGLRPASYSWSGTTTDGAARLSGKLTGSCTATGRAEGHESDSPGAGAATVARTLIAQAAATAHCSFAITFPSGSIRGTALITSTLTEGPTTGRSTESAKITVLSGTGLFAHRTGRGSGKVVTPVPPTTFTEPTINQGPGFLTPMIPAVDTQRESWHLTLRL